MDIKQQKIIDFHMHPYITLDECSCMYNKDFCLPPMEAMEDLKAAGIDHICGSVIKPGKYDLTKGFEQIKELNDTALELEKMYDGYYTPGFHIHPGFVKESLETIEFMHKNGYKLIGELVPYMQGWKDMGLNYASKELQEILDLAGEYEMVLNFHTILDQQEEMNKMIENNKRITFVIAHPGQRADYEKQLDRLKRFDNTYLDLSGTGIFRYGTLYKGVKEVGSQRFIFGTDYPISNPGMYVQALLYEHITDEQRADMYYNNAKRIMGW